MGDGDGAEEGAVEVRFVEVDAWAGAVLVGGAEELAREDEGGGRHAAVGLLVARGHMVGRVWNRGVRAGLGWRLLLKF